MHTSHGRTTVEQDRDRTELRLRARVGDREEFAFYTETGLRSPDSLRRSELRLLDALAEDPPDSLLVVRANYGVVGVVMGAFAGRVWMTERSARAARLCRHNARRNRVDSSVDVATAADPRAIPAEFDAAALAPPAYESCDVLRRRLADALVALEPGGHLYLAAPVGGGARRYRRTLADLCDDLTVLDDREGPLVLRGRRPGELDPPQYAEPRPLAETIEDTPMRLVSYPGLFSATGIDDGTRALARTVAFGEDERVLDLACGYGPLGIYASLRGCRAVTLTDDDRVATVCARESARESGVSGCEVRHGDGVAAVRDETFDRVVCNPPTHAGAGVLRDLLGGARDVLAAHGEVCLVHHRGVRFDRYVEPYFDRIEATERGAYRVVTARP